MSIAIQRTNCKFAYNLCTILSRVLSCTHSSQFDNVQRQEADQSGWARAGKESRQYELIPAESTPPKDDDYYFADKIMHKHEIHKVI